MAHKRFRRAGRTLIDQLAALVFLAGVVGVALVTMAFEEPPPLEVGTLAAGSTVALARAGLLIFASPWPNRRYQHV
jgi:hypothetical protein